ncbi:MULTISPECIES: LamG domain-containing protein [unclassified Mesorhizobium]|nr:MULTISPECIES: LamG domain-containing protein [unclassified Mesorhizobium]
MTANGDAQIDTAQFKFGASSSLFDGTGDYWSAGTSSDWNLSTANSDQFTIEFFIRPQGSPTGTFGVLGKGGADFFHLGWWVELSDLKPRLQFSVDGGPGGSIVSVAGGSTALSQSVFSHVAIDKDSSGKIRIYINGAMNTSATPANSVFFNASYQLEIGRTGAIGTLMNGWLDEVRITKGVARYASDGGFTAPSAAFPRS